MSEPRHELFDRLKSALTAREERGLLRSLHLPRLETPGALNLADNDYLALARDPRVIEAACKAARAAGCGAAASPLITGYREEHQRLETELCGWMDFPSGLLWTSGFAANQAVLSHLPGKGDLILADRLIHHSMIAGVLRSGARFLRYPHNDPAALEKLLAGNQGNYRTVFVATESVFSMDGDAPDLKAIAGLKERYPFIWILDEAHALGWYGPGGAGLAAREGVSPAVDILVGTLGKALGSQGAFTLFHQEVLREYLINESGEFIFSTYLSPAAAAAASAAIQRCRELAGEQPQWHDRSRGLRQRLRDDGWNAAEGDSPIVPVRIGDPDATVALGAFLREQQIFVGAVRPPAVPPAGSRLRISLKRGIGEPEIERLVESMNNFRQQ